MKIENTTPMRSVRRSRLNKVKASGNFSLGTVASIAEPMSLKEISAPQAILFIAEVVLPGEMKERAFKWGESVLDHLDILRKRILSGTVSAEDVEQLRLSLQQRVREMNDKRLLEILDHIELRAAVEVAKLEIAGKKK